MEQVGQVMTGEQKWERHSMHQGPGEYMAWGGGSERASRKQDWMEQVVHRWTWERTKEVKLHNGKP